MSKSPGARADRCAEGVALPPRSAKRRLDPRARMEAPAPLDGPVGLPGSGGDAAAMLPRSAVGAGSQHAHHHALSGLTCESAFQ